MFDQHKANIAKGIVQKQAVILSAQNDNLLLSWATGCGKTYAVLQAILDYCRYKPKMWPKIYIMLKETSHVLNWKEEFRKHDYGTLADKIEFFCYASLHKYIDSEVDILILDECHALSEMREDYLKTIKCDKIISLSATVDGQVKNRIKSYKQGYFEYHIGLQDAIELGILPKPSIKVAYIDLDDNKKEFAWKSPKAKKAKDVMLTAKAYYNRLAKKIEWWDELYKKEGHEWQKNKWIQQMGFRKKMMAKFKTDAAQLLLQSIADKKYICFCGSIEQASELGADWAIHSKIKPELRAQLIEEFNNGGSRHIYAVNMLRESMNLNGIEAAMIVQLDNQRGTTEQIFGRAMRAIAPEIYILILRDTKDEEYLDRALQGISSNYITEYVWPQEEEKLTL